MNQLAKEKAFLLKKQNAREIALINESIDLKADALRRQREETKRDVARMSAGHPFNDEVQGYWGDEQGRLFADNETDASRSVGERKAMHAIGLALIQRAVVKTPLDVSDLLEACQLLGEDKVTTLDKGLPQVLGGNGSPNLFRLPVNKDGTLDLAALYGTALSPATQWLKLGNEFVPSPLYLGAATPMHLAHIQEDGVLDCGLFLDLQPISVAIDTAAKFSKSEFFDEELAMIDIARAARVDLTRFWEKGVLNYHKGWAITAQLHVRHDIADDEIAIRPEDAEFIAEREGVHVDTIDGREFDFTGYPLVNAACKPTLRVRVLDEYGLMPHFGLSPLTTERMGRDNDGDAPTLSNMGLTVSKSIPNLLSRKDN